MYFKNKQSSILAITIILSSCTPNAESVEMSQITSAIGSAFGSEGFSFGDSSSFGTVAFKCDNPLNANFQSLLGRISGACGAIGQLNTSKNFSVGPCTLDASAAKCAKQSLSSFCNNTVGKIVSYGKDGEKILLSPIENVGLSSKNSILTGGDIVMTGADVSCSNRTETMTDKIRYGNIKETAVGDSTVITKMPGFGAFDRNVEVARDCIRAAGLANKNLDESTSLCVNKKAYALPKNKTESEKQISETAVKHLSPPDKGIIPNMAVTEADMRKKMEDCDGKDDTSSCEKDVYNPSSGTGNASKMEEVKAEIELNRARELKVMEDAAMGPNLIVHFDDKSIASLPAQTKAEYGSAAKRQMAFKTAYRYLASENSSIDKEYLSVVEAKMEMAALPFYEQNAVDDIEKAME